MVYDLLISIFCFLVALPNLKNNSIIEEGNNSLFITDKTSIKADTLSPEEFYYNKYFEKLVQISLSNGRFDEDMVLGDQDSYSILQATCKLAKRNATVEVELLHFLDTLESFIGPTNPLTNDYISAFVLCSKVIGIEKLFPVAFKYMGDYYPSDEAFLNSITPDDVGIVLPAMEIYMALESRIESPERDKYINLTLQQFKIPNYKLYDLWNVVYPVIESDYRNNKISFK